MPLNWFLKHFLLTNFEANFLLENYFKYNFLLKNWFYANFLAQYFSDRSLFIGTTSWMCEKDCSGRAKRVLVSVEHIIYRVPTGKFAAKSCIFGVYVSDEKLHQRLNFLANFSILEFFPIMFESVAVGIYLKNAKLVEIYKTSARNWPKR